MKAPKTKAQIRAEIDAQVNDYIHHGGSVHAVPMGASGREPGGPLPLSIHFDRQQQARTPVPDVVQAIEARRLSKAPGHKTLSRPRRRKKLIYDDFGQPLRWQWIEE